VSGLVHDPTEETPLHRAIKQGSSNLVHLLCLAGADQNIPYRAAGKKVRTTIPLLRSRNQFWRCVVKMKN
jgi:ankyrin repeat protein